MTTVESQPTRRLYTACPVCGSNDLSNRYVVDGFTIAQCAACSLQFVREQMTNDTLKPYYDSIESDYIYDDPANLVNLNYYYTSLKRLITRDRPAGKILDVGCCGGQFLDIMGPEWDRHGNELSPHFAEEARRKYGANLFQGTLQDFPRERGPFDVVTLMDMLDHCPDPVTELGHANALLRRGGLVVVKVHNISCLWARVTRDRFYAFIPPWHLYYFNQKSLGRALEAAGFRVTQTCYMAHRLALKTVPYRLARGKQTGLYHSIYKLLSKSRLGDIGIYKNLHDLITMIAVKERDV